MLIIKVMLCMLSAPGSRLHHPPEGCELTQRPNGLEEVPFWPLATSMCSWIVFPGVHPAHRNWEATPLVLICAKGRKNVICKCESIVPPTQTGPPITRVLQIPRMASMAFTEGMCHQDEPPTVWDGSSAKWKCRATDSKIKNFKRATVVPPSVIPFPTS